MKRDKKKRKLPSGNTPVIPIEREMAWPDGLLVNLAILSVITMIFYLPVFLHPTAMVWGNDLLRLDSEYKYLDWRGLNEWGTLPLWDPVPFGGMSRTGDQGPGYFSVLALPFFFSRLPFFFGIYYFVQSLLGTWGMYLFTRRSGCSAFASVFAAIAFCFSARVAGHVFAGHLGMVPACMALPWILWATEHALARPSPKSAILWGTVTAAAALNGPSIQLVYFHLLFTLAYVLARVFTSQGSFGEIRQFAKLAACLAMGTAVFLGGTAAWLLPTVRQTLMLSARASGADFKFSTIGSVAPQDLFRFIWPWWNVPQPEVFRSDADHAFFWATASFVGAVTLALALAAVARARRGGLGHWLGGLAVLAILLSLGEHSPVYRLAYHIVPGISLFRVPAYFLLYANLLIALLAAHFLSGARDERWPVAVVISAVLVGQIALFLVIFAGRIAPQTMGMPWLPLLLMCALSVAGLMWSLGHWRERTWQIVCLSMLFTEIYLCWRPHLQMVDPDRAFPKYSVAEFLSRQEPRGAFRTLDTTGILGQEIAVRHGLEILSGYRAGVYGHFLELYRKIWTRDYSDATEVQTHAPDDIKCPSLLDLMNVKYLVSSQLIADPSLVKVFQSPPGEMQQPILVYERKSAMPRAFVVSEAATPPPGISLLDAVCSTDFRQRCLVEDSPSQGGAQYQALTPELNGFGDMTLRFTMDKPGVAVLSQTWHPDWIATDHGVAVPVRRVNHAQVGVPLPAGEHVLRVWYRPWDFYLGCAISAATWCILLITGGWLLLASKHKKNIPAGME